MLPTPTLYGNYNRKGASATSGNGLIAVVNKLERYPTPRANDSRGTSPGQKVFFDLQSAVEIEKERRRGQLNPDWVEWLMCWPVGWTDIETPNHRLLWLHPSHDPADAENLHIPRITSRRENRAARIKAIGNGQYPPTAFVAFEWGLAVLQTISGKSAGTQEKGMRT